MDDMNKDNMDFKTNEENINTSENEIPQENTSESFDSNADTQPIDIEVEPQKTNEYSSYNYSNPNQNREYSQSYYSSNQQPPNSTYYYTGTPDNGGFNANNNQGKKKKGIKIVLSVVAIILAVSIGFGLGSLTNSDNNTDKNSSTNGDSTIIGSSETPDSTPQVTGDKLPIEKIAEIGRASNVGVLVYSNNGYTANKEAGEGTGIVAKVSDDGKYTYILTCAHVISDKGVSVKILLEDGTTYNADIVGFDQQTDVGVLRVQANNLNCAEFGDFSKLKVGSAVYAVGNPGGSEFFGSFTNGIVSAISRSINNEIGYTMDCIQHNAAINPGNSGGALYNEYGQVIGINSSKIASTEYEGMSFSIPISTALEVANNIIAKGYVPNRPKLGITYSLASSHSTYAMVVQIKGLPAGSLIVRSISADSSLKDTKVQIGDMITAVNGQKLDTADVLLDIIDQSQVGDTLKLQICRVNTDYSIEEFEITVTLVEDKGSSTPTEEETTYVNPFDYFNQYSYGN